MIERDSVPLDAMMDLVWLLNATAVSAYETKNLLQEFIRQRESLVAILVEATGGDAARREYLLSEIQRHLQSMNELEESLADASGILQALQKKLGGDSDESS